jgi:protein involved in polysaccharide export with SLBB domain
MSGDTLRIIRDARELPDLGGDSVNLYIVRPDGTFSYPYAGTVKAAGMTPEQLAAEIARRQANIYRDPAVTVNIASAPGNRVFVGGAVRQPSAYDLSATASLDQALVAAGGLTPLGDSHHVALLRQNTDGLYQVYFADFSKLLSTTVARRPVMLQRGDVVFVPNSIVGNAVEDIDLYLYQLVPFSRQVGVAFAYQLNGVRDSLNVQQSTTTP